MAVASINKFPLDFLSLFYVFITQQEGLHSFPTDNCILKVLEKSEEWLTTGNNSAKNMADSSSCGVSKSLPVSVKDLLDGAPGTILMQ